MLWLGLQAAARRLPFLPTRAGLGNEPPGAIDVTFAYLGNGLEVVSDTVTMLVRSMSRKIFEFSST